MQQRKNITDALPTITLVTPSYNQGAFLEKTILSVLNQRYPKLEYMIMDGGSTDGSQEIIERYSSRLTYWQSQKDEGQGDAIINGWKMGKGEIVGWLNSDDVLMPNALFKIAKKFSEGEFDIVTGEEICIDENDIIRSYRLMWKGPSWMYRAALIHPGQPGTFYSRRLAEKVKYFDTTLCCAMEFDLVIKMVKCGAKIACLTSPVSALRIHDETKSKTLKDVFLQENRAVFEKYAIFPFNNSQIRELMVKIMRYPYALRYINPCRYKETRKKIAWFLNPTKLPFLDNKKK